MNSCKACRILYGKAYRMANQGAIKERYATYWREVEGPKRQQKRLASRRGCEENRSLEDDWDEEDGPSSWEDEE